ncbi:MAG: type IV secretion system protein [Betaproteobacteria bacterium]|nr:type IV secretion system protein [Betaproteobacteria bacterium]
MFNSFKKKSEQEADRRHKDVSPIHQAHQFIEASQDFERSRTEEALASKRVAWRVAAAGCVVGLLGVGALFFVLPLKTTEHWLVRVDNNTGAVDTVYKLKDGVRTLPEAVDRANLVRYVINRENYDWETIQALYDATILMSSNAIQKEYKLFWSQPNAPHRILKNQAKVVVRNPSVSFIGDLAQVRFEKYVINTTGDLATQQGESHKWIATIAFHYANPPMTDAERLVNPLGFEVTSYRVDPENLR